MGIKLFSISDSSYDKSPRVEYVNSTPDPLKFTILRALQLGDHLVCEIKYDTVENYEGKKILVYQNTRAGFLKRCKSLDPHFSDNVHMTSPVARFKPTDEGWRLAIRFAIKVLPQTELSVNYE